MLKIYSRVALLFLLACQAQAVVRPSGTGYIGSSDGSELTFSSYKLPVTRDGKVDTRVAISNWYGDWPEPVINVHAEQMNGTVRIEAYDNLRTPTLKHSCTIKNGLYHPWSNTPNSVEDYWSLNEVSDYEILKDIPLPHPVFGVFENLQRINAIPKGSKIINEFSQDSDICGATLQMGKQAKALTYPCASIQDKNLFRKLTTDERFSEQWLSLICEEKNPDGSKMRVFIQDVDLLLQTGLQRGSACGFGHISASQLCTKN